eukprot:TRINITY_DN42744_c0_g1_i1.p1 TRINITY_DN42744_c0_g1~~TRINITY_DN42744_c0_g1_i1.p1  ORF type:complete len:355 (+),score=53.89 TRINITY_DN42744_c0_g1_i1:42-1106(+)
MISLVDLNQAVPVEDGNKDERIVTPETPDTQEEETQETCEEEEKAEDEKDDGGPYGRGIPRGGLKLLKEKEKQAKAVAEQAKRHQAEARRRAMQTAEQTQKMEALQHKAERIERVRAMKDLVVKDKTKQQSIRNTYKSCEVQCRKKELETAMEIWAADQLTVKNAKIEGVAIITQMKENQRSYHEKSMLLHEKVQKENEFASQKRAQKEAFESFSKGRKQLHVLNAIGKHVKDTKDRSEHQMASKTVEETRKTLSQLTESIDGSLSNQSRQNQKTIQAARNDAAAWASQVLCTPPAKQPLPRSPSPPSKIPLEISDARYRSLTANRYSCVAPIPEPLLGLLDQAPPVSKRKWKI